MSAYLVHEDTIDYLVSFALRGEAGQRYCYRWRHPRKPAAEYPDLRDLPIDVRARDLEEGTAIGTVLWHQNDRSVNARYGLTAPGPTYQYRAVADVSPLTVLKSIRCLRYQSCETDDFDRTYAAELLDAIEAQAIAWLTPNEPWGWTRANAAARVAELRAKRASEAAVPCAVPIDAEIVAPCERPRGHAGPCRAFSLEGV